MRVHEGSLPRLEDAECAHSPDQVGNRQGSSDKEERELPNPAKIGSITVFFWFRPPQLWNVSAFAQCLVGAFRYTPSDGCLCSLLVGAEGSHSRSWCREPVFTKRGCISIMSHLNWNFLWHLLQGANFTQMIRQLAAVQPVLWLGGGNALFVIWKKCCGTWIHNDLDNQWLDTRQILCRCLRSRSCSGH